MLGVPVLGRTEVTAEALHPLAVWCAAVPQFPHLRAGVCALLVRQECHACGCPCNSVPAGSKPQAGGGTHCPFPSQKSRGRGSGCAAGAGMQGSSRGWLSPCVAKQGDPTASPSLSFQDILFCPRQRALFGLQPCQRLLTPSLALLAQPGSARPGGRTAQVGSCHRLSQPGRAPLAPCSQGLQSLGGGPCPVPDTPSSAVPPAPGRGASRASRSCGSGSWLREPFPE